MRSFLFILLASISFASPSSAQEAVFVYGNGGDLVGERLLYKVKEELKGSNSFYVATTSTYPRWNLYITTLDPDANSRDEGLRTIYALTIGLEAETTPTWYVTQVVGTCGRNAVDRCAESMVAKLSEHSDSLAN